MTRNLAVALVVAGVLGTTRPATAEDAYYRCLLKTPESSWAVVCDPLTKLVSEEIDRNCHAAARYVPFPDPKWAVSFCIDQMVTVQTYFDIEKAEARIELKKYRP